MNTTTIIILVVVCIVLLILSSLSAAFGVYYYRCYNKGNVTGLRFNVLDDVSVMDDVGIGGVNGIEQDFAISNNTRRVEIQWDNIPNVTTFKVFVNGAAPIETKDSKITLQLETCKKNIIEVSSVFNNCESARARLEVSTLLDAPTNFTFSRISEDNVEMKWSSVPGADEYIVTIKRPNQEIVANITTKVPELSYEWKLCGEYNITVVAKAGECVSSPSSPYNLTTRNASGPPTGLTAYNRSYGTEVQWEADRFAKGYLLYYGDKPGEYKEPISTERPQHIFSPAPFCGRNYFAVRSVSRDLGSCVSNLSSEVHTDFVPTVPQNLRRIS
jgi:hypothetical protein